MWIEEKYGYINTDTVEYFFLNRFDIVAHTISGENRVIKEFESEKGARSYLLRLLDKIEEAKK